MPARDRRARVLASNPNGIDFGEVVNDLQTALRVHFLNVVPLKQALLSPPVTITGGESIRTVPVRPIADADWGQDDGHLTLDLTVDAPGDFSTYTLTVRSPALDPFFA